MISKRDTQAQQQFGERVRVLRRERGLSQEGLGYACDLDRSYIGRVERGELNISLINIHIIAKALGVQIKELFNA